MLPIALVNEIDRLLQEGELSQRKIAIRLGVSRGTISAIVKGRRGLYGREPAETPSPLIPTSPPARCPRCGYRVYLPCLICLARQHKQNQIIMRLPAAEERASERKRRRSQSLPRFKHEMPDLRHDEFFHRQPHGRHRAWHR